MPSSLAAWTWLPPVSLSAWITSSRSTAGNDFQLRVAPRPLEQLPRQGHQVRNPALAGGRLGGEDGAGRRAFAGDFGRQVLQQHHVTLGHHIHAPEDALQLAHVSGPMVAFQRSHGAGGDGFGLGRLPGGQLVQEVFHQQGNIALAVAQRRHVNAHAVEPIKEVFPELAGGHRLLQHLVGGRNDTDIRVNGGVAAHALEFPRLQDAQNLRLGRRGHVPDLVEEDDAALALLELARCAG